MNSFKLKCDLGNKKNRGIVFVDFRSLDLSPDYILESPEELLERTNAQAPSWIFFFSSLQFFVVWFFKLGING